MYVFVHTQVTASWRRNDMSTQQERHSPFHVPNMAFDVVVIAASLGGVAALIQVLSALPADFPAAIIVVQHLSPTYPSQLADLFSRHTSLCVKWAEEGDRLQPGVVFVAPPNQHLLLGEGDVLTLCQSPRVQWVRPSADVLFDSVATSYRERAIAVVLTGGGRDGARGVQMMKQMGGRVLVQDMATSRASGMPSAAISTGCIDFVLPLRTIAPALIALVMVTPPNK
jgi:two-component system, chemotaxis family, protein-glutamate methylesterase/glutaminase